MSDRFGAISITPPTGDTPLTPKHKAPQRPRPRPQPSKKQPRPKRTENRSLLLLAVLPILLVLTYGVGGFLFGASLLTHHLNSLLEESLHTSLQAKEARFNPFTLRLQLSGTTVAAMAPQEQSPPFLSIDHLAIDLSLLHLLRGSFASNDLDIHGLHATIIRRQDRSYNLPAPAATNGRIQENESLSLASLPLLFSLNNIKIRNSKVHFDDQVNNRQHHIEQIQLDLPTLANFSYSTTTSLTPHFSALINGSPVELTGEAAFPGSGGDDTGATNLTCKIEDLDLSPYFSYLPTTLPFRVEKGKGKGTIQIAFLPQKKGEGQLGINLQLTVTDASLTAAQHLAMTAPSVELKGGLRPFEQEIHIENLLVHKPLFSANDATVQADLATILIGEKVQETTDGRPRQRLRIDNLTIDEGALDYRQSQQETATGNWTAIKLTLQGYDNAPKQTAAPGSFKLSASRGLNGKEAGKPAALSWNGALNSRGLPEGELQTEGLPARALLAFLDPGQEATGTTNLHGRFAYDPSAGTGAAATLTDGTCEFHNLQLRDDQKPWFSAATVRLTGISLREKELDLGKISIQQGDITLHQGRLPSLLSADKPKVAALSLKEMEATGKATLLPARKDGRPLQLSEIRMKVGKLTSDTHSNLEISAKLDQGGALQAQGLVSLFPFRSALALNFNAIPLADIAPWLPNLPFFRSATGTLQGSGNYRFPESGFTGNLDIDAPVFRADEKALGLSAGQAQIKELSIKTKPLRIGINELNLDRPRFNWHQETASPAPADQVQSFLRGLMGNNAGPEAAATAALPNITAITFQQGTLTYTDSRLSPPWSPPVTALQGRITGLQEKGSGSTRFDLSGAIADAPFSLAGTVDFLSSPVNSSSKLELHGLPLQALAPQLTPLFALDPSSGSIDLLCDLNRENGEEKGEAQLILSDLRPQGADADTALPLALLNDGDNRIALLLALSDSKQSLIKQAATSFKTMLVKAEVAPLLLAGPEFSDLQDRQALPFAPGSAELIDYTVQEVVRRFAALLTVRPGIGLSLTGMADPRADREAIRLELEEKEKTRVTQLNEQRMQEWQRLQAQKKQQPPPSPPPGKIIEQNIPAKELAPPTPLKPKPITVTDAALHDLAQERALHVYDFLTALPGVGSERISLEDKTLLAMPDTPGNQVVIGLRAMPPSKIQ